MLKRLFLAFAVSAGLLSPSFAAGTIPLSLSQQFDKYGHVLSGCKLNLYQAGSSIPQIAYQDTALTIPVPGGAIITCDAYGRLPQFFLADGNVKILLTDANGVTQIAADNILVIGNSSGGGGGPSVDPTTILATGDMKVTYGTGNLVGFVRANGRTIGSSTSGATERSNADTQALFQYLWNTDPNLVVSTGRGASANADWVANKQITLPDWRGRAIAGLADMGNSATTVLTSGFFGADPTVLGTGAGNQGQSIALTNFPTSVPLSVGGTITSTSTVSDIQQNAGNISFSSSPGGSLTVPSPINSGPVTSVSTPGSGGQPALTGTLVGGGNALPTVPPMMVTTIYLKL